MSPNKYLEFVTPTAVDLRELFTLGLGSKRGDETKIGHKGSGMKFTLALLHRLGSHLQVEVDGAKWTSRAVSETIRGNTHDLIHLVEHDGDAIACHISANAGADTWNQPWFALRELLQNCIDEGGSFQECGEDDLTHIVGGTVMRVLLTPELDDAWQHRDRWHHPRHDSVLYSSDHPGLYFHGFLIFTPADGVVWRYAYDVTGIIKRENLSEDRQLRNVDLWQMFRDILKGASSFPDSVYGEMLTDDPPQDVFRLMQVADGAARPSGFDADALATAFVAKHGRNRCYTMQSPSSAEWYHAKAAGFDPVRVSYQIMNLLDNTDVVPAASSLLPAIEARLKAVRLAEVDSTAVDRLKQALKITRRLRPDGCKVELVNKRHECDVDIKAGGLAIAGENKVLLLADYVERAPLPELVECLVEEYMHIESGSGDASIEFQRALIRKIGVLLTPRLRQTADADAL